MSKHYACVERVRLMGRKAFKIWTIAESEAEAYSIQLMLSDRKPARAFVGTEFPNEPVYPPPCDGNNSAGDLLAQGQYEAAMDGDDCTGAACLLTRGSD